MLNSPPSTHAEFISRGECFCGRSRSVLWAMGGVADQPRLGLTKVAIRSYFVCPWQRLCSPQREALGPHLLSPFPPLVGVQVAREPGGTAEHRGRGVRNLVESEGVNSLHGRGFRPQILATVPTAGR